MEMSEDKVEKRKEKIKNWFRNPYNLGIILILIFAFAVRLYYFSLTQDQAVWWDEAEYLLKAKSIALGTPETGFWYGRPIMFSVILSFFYLFGLGEITIRFFILLISLATILLIYLVGKQLFNKKLALIAALLFSLVYINLFYTMRIMNDVPHLFLGLLAFYFFFTKKPKLIWFVFPILALATLIRFTSFFFFIILAVYIISTEGLRAFKNKHYWISGFLAILVALPYLIWSQLKFSSPLYAVTTAGGGAVTGLSLSYGISNLKQYLFTFPSYFHSVLLILFLLGIVLFVDVFMGFDLIFKNKNKKIAKKFLLLIWIIIPLLYFGFGVSHYEDRYIFMAFPSIFFIIAFAIIAIQTSLSKYNKKIALAVVILVIIAGGFQLLQHSDGIIKARTSSYGPVKEAGFLDKRTHKSRR